MSMTFISETADVKKPKEVKNTVPEKKIEKLSFVGVGDNLIHDSIFYAADARANGYGDGRYDFNHLYENIKSEIQKYDLRYINQESIIAGDNLGISNYPRFNSPQDLIPALKNAGFNLINMANNHTLDKGSSGINSSLDIWDNTDGFYYSGMYRSQEDRDNPLIIDKNGIKVAMLCYTYDTNGMRPNYAYQVPYLREDAVRKDVAAVKDKCDFIMVSTHWGTEGVEALDFTQKKFAKLFNDLGVDVVLGTHAHRIQKVEWMTNPEGKKTLVYYGTGNFVHHMIPPINFLEGMATWTFVKDGDKKYIENPKFIPLVFHIERNQYGYDGSVYKLSDYPVELANKHSNLRHSGNYYLNVYKNTVNRLIPQEFLN